ncbi:SAM-dependent methyltransferase [Nocardia sp. CA-120079]|uniref:SAM-dependent methyltransferase n=1 Tax=Nocardia sp. CA-120079 TaxID=3239974 RepID=UPI003D97A702
MGEFDSSTGHIDFGQPVAILMVGLLHYLMDEDHPFDIVARLRDVMALGSILAFTHASSWSSDELVAQVTGDTEGTPAQCQFRTPDHLAVFLQGFEVVEPGLVPAGDRRSGTR